MGHTIGKLYSLTGQISIANIKGVLQNPNYSYPALHFLNFRNLVPYKLFTIPLTKAHAHTHTHTHTCTRTHTCHTSQEDILQQASIWHLLRQTDLHDH